MVFHTYLGDKFEEGWNNVTGSINKLGDDFHYGFSFLGEQFKKYGNQIKDAYVKGFWRVEHKVESAGKKTVKALEKGFSSVGRIILDEAEEVGAAGINFVTDGVEDIDKGLGFVTAEIVQYVPKMYIYLIPRILKGIYQVIVDVVPELLTIPSNIIVFLFSLFLTVVGEHYLAERTAEHKKNFGDNLEDLDPSILHPDLDLDEAERILSTIASSL